VTCEPSTGTFDALRLEKNQKHSSDPYVMLGGSAGTAELLANGFAQVVTTLQNQITQK
jgi:hypothetical protein